MKLHHTAALALMGWYLILPPRDARKPEGYNPDAPLKQWYQARAFDSAKACEDARQEFIGYSETGESADHKLMLDALESGRCISTDDPRLKSN
jgi:hypothetical protein